MRRLPAAAALFALFVLSEGGSPLAAQPGAFELLDQVRKTYAGLSSYRDRGEIETIVVEGGAELVARRRFESAAVRGGGFRFVLETGTGSGPRREVLWREGSQAFHYDSARGQVRPVASPLAALVQTLGAGGQDALVVPALLGPGEDTALPDPEVAAVDGPEPCGEGSCWVLSLSRMSGAVESRLWIDRASHLVREVEVRIQPVGEVMAQALGRRRTRSEERAATVRVHHRVEAGGGPAAAGDVAFVPPAGTARVAAWKESEQPDAGFGEEITVELRSVAVRVVSAEGAPILGLEPGDFQVWSGRREIPVAAVDWVASGGAGGPPALPQTVTVDGEEVALPPPDAPAGKLVVVFVQADNNDPGRTRGHLAALPHVESFLAGLGPDDQAAVVSFDSHLKLWLDFTRDRGAVREAVGKAIRFGNAPPADARNRGATSLGRHFAAGEAKAAATPERALELTADALRPLSGEKVIVYLGWGLGRYDRGSARMTPDYSPARRSLEAARAAVFVLDVTSADLFHSLEIGLKQVAADTGGTYGRMSVNARRSVALLTATLSGHYVLSFDGAELRGLSDPLRVELRDRDGIVLQVTAIR